MTTSPATDTRFRRLFHANEQAMREYCSRRVPTDEVNDAAAEVFLVAWRKIDDIPAGDDARLWLYGVARNVIRNADRSRRRRGRLSAKVNAVATPEPVPGPEHQVVRQAQDQAVLEALAELPDDDQELIRLRTWEELSRAEAAAVMGISPEAADMRLLRARRRLEKALRRRGFFTTDRTNRPRAADERGTP